MASFWSITPSPFPPFAGLSYSAKARNPFRSTPGGGGGCAVRFPNNSVPLSMTPLPFRSSASHASSDPAAVQESFSFLPSLLKSKLTPLAAFVSANPSPATSTKIREVGTHWHCTKLQAYPSSQTEGWRSQGGGGV